MQTEFRLILDKELAQTLAETPELKATIGDYEGQALRDSSLRAWRLERRL